MLDKKMKHLKSSKRIYYASHPNFTPTSSPPDRNLQSWAPLTKSLLFAKLDEAEAKMASQVEPAQSTPSTAINNHYRETVQPVASSATSPLAAEAPNPGCGPQDSTENGGTLYDLPTKKQLEKAFELDVLDEDGKKHNFGELCHNGGEGVQRTLVIFIRHWFCGVCQTYISALTSSLPPSTLSSLTPPTRLTVIGCGAASLIPQYLKITSCPYTLYTDPTISLYKTFNFGRTLDMGKEPGYLKGKSMWGLSLGGISQTIKTGWKARGGGDWMQVGGEFLFVKGSQEGGNGEWNCEWAHRMRTTRDHAEVEELKELLGMKGGEMEEKKA